MSWSNIFLQLITGAGPVLGEGLLQGWQTSIELQGFSWSAKLADDHEKEESAGPIGALTSAISSIAGTDPESRFRMGDLTFTKRFDIGSAQIHTCLDNELPVVSASITVLNIKQGGRAIHEPGFVLLATDGKFTSAKLDLRPTGNGVELVEEVTMSFQMIVVNYLKRMGKDNIPTIPFTFKRKTGS